ncbi:MAG: hypothetical protein Q7P63_14315 [Verrucomicrobiota bacterium JB022]|nr:hypothetical protein [Verrucomicrobiota bacterium JB022]
MRATLHALLLALLTGLGLAGCGTTPAHAPGEEMVFQQEIAVPNTVMPYEELDNQPALLNEDEVRHSTAWKQFSRAIWSKYFGENTFVYHVLLYVDEEGNVINAQVVQANSNQAHGMLLKACRQYRFEPGLKNGQPVKYYTLKPVSMLVSNY